MCIYFVVQKQKKKKERKRLFFDKKKERFIWLFFFCYQFDDEYDEANGADIFNFGLAVKPSKRLYV